MTFSQKYRLIEAIYDLSNIYSTLFLFELSRRILKFIMDKIAKFVQMMFGSGWSRYLSVVSMQTGWALLV